MLNKVFFCCLIIFTVTIASAQSDKHTVSGFIKQSVTGEPLPGANILLYKDSLDTSHNPLTGTSTNDYGFYVIPNLQQGTYYFIVRYIGFKPLIRLLQIKGQTENVTFNLEMTPEDISLEEIVISGNKEEQGSLSRIDVSPELLTKLPSLSGEVDLFRILQTLPGVKTANELSNGLYIRGGSPDQILTLVDGVILYNPSHIGNLASAFNSYAIRDIKLIKGGFPAQYGGRLSSILDIKLRSGTREKEKGIFGMGVINSFLTLEGPLSKNATYMISARSMYYDALQRSFDKNSLSPRYNFYDVNGKMNFELTEKNIISFTGLLNKDNLYSPPVSDDFNYNIQWENRILSFNWLHIGSESLLLNSVISYIDYKFQSIIGGQPSSAYNYYSSSDLTDISLKQDAEVHWLENHTFKAGLELIFHNYDILYSDIYDSRLADNPFAGDKINSFEQSVYFQNESQFTPLLKTNIGGRLYYFGGTKSFSFEPRVSASYAITENMIIKAGYAEAHQFLHLITKNDISLPTDLWYPSTSLIKPGKSIQYIFGVDNYFNQHVYLVSIEAYYNKMSELYEFKNGAKLDPFQNNLDEQLTSGKGEAYGVELFLNKRAGSFSGWVGYSLSWTKRKFNDLNGGEVFYPKYDRRHDLSVVLTYDFFPSFTAGLTWVYSTGARFTLPPSQYTLGPIGPEPQFTAFNFDKINSSLFPDYHKLDLSFNYKFQWLEKPFEAYLSLLNVYNRHNPFAEVIVSDNSVPDGSKIKLKRLSFFPFIPTAGFNFRF